MAEESEKRLVTEGRYHDLEAGRLACCRRHRKSHTSWAELAEDKPIKQSPDFSVYFEPSGGRGGPREPRERIPFEN